MSSLTKLLQKQRQDDSFSTAKSNLSVVIDDDNELTNAVSIEGVAVVPTNDHEASSPLEFYTNGGSFNQRSPIAINNNRTSSVSSTAPPIRAPMSASIHRQPSSATMLHQQQSQQGSYPSSFSIPFSVPNSNSNTELSSSAPRHSGLPSNISMIESTNITSPVVNTGQIEARFIVSKHKVAQAQAQSFSKSSQSSSGFFNRSRKGSQMDLGSFYNNPSSLTTTTASTSAMGVTPVVQYQQHEAVISGSPSSNSSMESRYSQSKHSSMVDLKRFFKKPGNGSPLQPSYLTSPSHSYSNSMQMRERSGSISSSYSNNVTQYTTPQVLPFSKRYGRFGENLGAGAGGAVRLVKRLNDGVLFAVKEFRQRSANETRREYAKKITGEYCIGSTLRHANIIETVEIAYENDRILQVMEYCDYDLFALVMSNKMSTEEVDCCFKQILTGIQYLHHMGLAHRDLKLDNCVVNGNGIVKIIDFGSAVVFSYPFSQTLIEASGIVGSDPYLSPETLVFSKYDPRPVDIWSVAMIYCCMTLKKFPWKVPKLSDNSFKLFCTGRDSDSLSALLTRTPPPLELQSPKKFDKPTSGLSNLSKAFSKPPVPDVGKLSLDQSLSDSTEKVDDTTPIISTTAPIPEVLEEEDADAEETQPVAPTEPSVVQPAEQEPQEEQGESHTSNLIGEARLLQALPQHTRSVIGKMVELAPACRGSIDDVMNDSWVQSVSMCTVENHYDGSGIAKPVFHMAQNHHHTQVDQSEAHIASLEKKKNRKQ